MVEKFHLYLSGISVLQKTEQLYLDYISGYTSRISLKFYELIDHNIWKNFGIHHMAQICR